MIVGGHMSWCQGDHGVYGECQIERAVTDELSLVLVGVPCDSARIDLEGFVVDVAGLDAALAALADLRPLLEASDQDTDCDLHDHPDDDDDEDEDELVCGGCGAGNTAGLFGQPPFDSEGHASVWWCRECCLANGHDPSRVRG